MKPRRARTLIRTGLTIFNGYRKSKELWRDNSRVKRLKMYVGGKTYGVIHLKDAYNYTLRVVGEQIGFALTGSLQG